MRKPQHTAVVDWDGTAVPSMWPEKPTEFNPGFVEQMRRLHNAGFHILIFSARLSPYEAGSLQERDPAVVWEETQYVREMLDKHGLSFIDIWTRHGKPTGFVYIDDRAERYHGHKGSWKRVVDKVIARAATEAPVFAAALEDE